MFDRHSSFMKFSALVALAAFSFTALQSAPARAYNYATHSRIAELAVRAMNGFCYGAASACTPPLLIPPQGEESVFAAYLAAIYSAPAKLVLLKTGLPTNTIDSGFNPVPGDSDDTTGYPYNAASSPSCPLLPRDQIPGTARDLNRLNDFRIADLDYFPLRNGNALAHCGIEFPGSDIGTSQGTGTDPARITERVSELVLGWHAGGVDDHLNDTALWFRPTLIGTWGLYFEAASWVWEAGVGTILLPFVLLWDLFSGDSVSLDASYALARQYNPVDEIQGAIPGVGDVRSDMFTGLWHFEAVGATVNRFNDTRGMWYPDAGPDHPGAFDVVILAATQLSGLSLNAHIADAPSNYGGFDKIHRTWPQWQAHTVGMLEWSPLHNLAAYGWARFKSDPSNAVGLGWPLHAIGDACEPQHVTSTSSWGHRTYEDWVSGDGEQSYLPRVFDGTGAELPGRQQALDSLLADSIMAGFRWWKQFSNGENMAALIHDMAVETRFEVQAGGDWPFKDSYSTRYLYESDSATADYGAEVMRPNDAAVRQLLTNAIGGAIAMLAVAAPKIKNNPDPGTSLNCPAGQVFAFEQRTRHVQSSRGPGYDQVYTVPGCGGATAAPPSIGTPASNGIGQIGAGNCPTGTCGKTNGAACSNASECISRECFMGLCGKSTGEACAAPSDCAQGECTSKVCGKAQGETCTQNLDCASALCVAGLCGKPAGQTCSAATECASNQCWMGLCGQPNGSSCATGTQCASTVCVANTCGEPNGAACTSGLNCALGECSSGVCGSPLHASCSSGASCASGACLNGQCCTSDGGTCSSQNDCCGGICSAGVCTIVK